MPVRDSAPLGAPCWIDLFTADVDGARAFYGDLFAWTSTDPDPDHGGYVNFSKDGVLVAGCMQNDGTSGMPDVWSTYLAVADAAATTDSAAAAGAQVIVPAMAVGDLGTMAVVIDPAGAAIGMWQPGTHQGFGVLAEPGTPAWFELHTRDYEAAVPFYRATFGWDAHVMSDTPDFRYTTLGEGDGALAGVMDSSAYLPEGVPAHWAVYLGADDTDKAVARVEELGGTVVDPPKDTPYGRLALVTDPTGSCFRLVQPPA
jgi:predicted enzyme related to lactoylglutathione lyase